MSRANWKLVYQGTALPPPDRGGITMELQPIETVAVRKAKGDLTMEEGSLKRKWNCTWSRLNGEQVKSMMTVLKKNRTGEVEIYDAADGGITKAKVYYGAGAKVQYLLYKDDLRGQKYTAMSINFIEM